MEFYTETQSDISTGPCFSNQQKKNKIAPTSRPTLTMCRHHQKFQEDSGNLAAAHTNFGVILQVQRPRSFLASFFFATDLLRSPPVC